MARRCASSVFASPLSVLAALSSALFPSSESVSSLIAQHPSAPAPGDPPTNAPLLVPPTGASVGHRDGAPALADASAIAARIAAASSTSPNRPPNACAGSTMTNGAARPSQRSTPDKADARSEEGGRSTEDSTRL